MKNCGASENTETTNKKNVIMDRIAKVILKSKKKNMTDLVDQINPILTIDPMEVILGCNLDVALRQRSVLGILEAESILRGETYFSTSQEWEKHNA